MTNIIINLHTCVKLHLLIQVHVIAGKFIIIISICVAPLTRHCTKTITTTLENIIKNGFLPNVRQMQREQCVDKTLSQTVHNLMHVHRYQDPLILNIKNNVEAPNKR